MSSGHVADIVDATQLTHSRSAELRNDRPIASGVSQCAATAVEVEPSG
jgi:hypothetical protein